MPARRQERGATRGSSCARLECEFRAFAIALDCMHYVRSLGQLLPVMLLLGPRGVAAAAVGDVGVHVAVVDAASAAAADDDVEKFNAFFALYDHYRSFRFTQLLLLSSFGIWLLHCGPVAFW